METAYLCSNCGASVILNDDSDCKCCFCGTKFREDNVIDRPNGGFYVGALSPFTLRTITCINCGKTMG
jgi:DNA-directed RNA polymerase subunit RPC12/RpoP